MVKLLQVVALLRRSVVAGLVLWLACSSVAVADGDKHILILHSYHPRLGWTAAIMAGMQEILGADPKLSLQVEYLDTKRNPSPAYRSAFVEGVLVDKLQDHHFDLVLVSDNDAFAFAQRHRRDLLADVPLVFCGVNGFSPALIAGDANVTGVAEIPAFAETVELALHLHPASTDLIFIGETYSETGRNNDAALQQVAGQVPGPVATQFWNDLPLEQIEAQLEQLGPRQVVFLASVLRDRTGRVLSFEECAEHLRRHSQAPIYGFWDFFLGHGIVGGKLINGRAQGALAAGLARRILAGTKAAAIPVVTTAANRYMFDFTELERFGLGLADLPPDSDVIGRPQTFYQMAKWQIWTGVVVILLLSLLSFLLLRTMLSRRRAAVELAERARLAALGSVVGRVLAGGGGLRENLQQCAEALVRQTETCFGRIWTLSEEDPTLLELQASAGRYTRIDGVHSRKRVGELKVGKIAGNRQPYLSNAVLGDPAFTDQEWIRQEGIVAFAGYPLVVQDRLVGVVAFFSRKPLNERVLAAISSVADMVAVGIERIRAGEALQQAWAESEAGRGKIDAIVRSVADGLVVTDLENRVVLMNHAAEQQLGISFEIACGQPMELALHGKPFAEHLHGLLFDGQEEVDFELEIADGSDGVSRSILARTSTVRQGNDGIGGTVTILRDVTRERELDRMKNEFIAIAAHELRTPLTAVLGYTELLLDEAVVTPFSQEQKREFLGYIYEKGELLERIIDDLLDLGRIETGRVIVLDKEICEMVGLVKEIIMHHQQETDRHRFEAACPVECIRIEIDRGKMLRVFDNLLSNAVKYSPEGGVIRITGGLDDGYMQVCVADEGIGMTPEQVAHMFDKFYRADASNTAVGGLGLGMTIAKGIIEAHGGSIRVESQPGQGTKVFFRLPLPEAAATLPTAGGVEACRV